MTTAFGALLAALIGAALVVALGAYFWVNRTPSPNERFDEYGRVPLFGVDLTATASMPVQQSESEALAEAHADLDEVGDAIERPAEATPPLAIKSFAPQHAEARPVGEPVAIDSSALEARNGSSAASVSNPKPANGNRSAGKGWGPQRGWPVQEESGVTPRFVPPVRDAGVRPPMITPRDTPSYGNGVSADGVPGSIVEGHRIRFSTPMEGTLQFLPGRLEISSGLDTGREIRFVRLPGPNGTEVTFGRNEGPLYRHIQLRDQTVSREHARMTHVDGRWLLTNLSNTNPVAHNGRILSPGEHQALEDGDRLEMGEVVFSFRSR